MTVAIQPLHTLGLCWDCGVPVPKPPRGPYPRRCPKHRQAEMTRRHLIWWRRTHPEPYTPTEDERKAMVATKNQLYRERHPEDQKRRNAAAYAAARKQDGGGTPEQWRARNKKYHARIKVAVIAYLGGKCVRCNFADPRALEADHIEGGGIKDKRSTYMRYRAILAGTEEGVFQLLCCNCNRIRQHEDGQWRGYLK